MESSLVIITSPPSLQLLSVPQEAVEASHVEVQTANYNLFKQPCCSIIHPINSNEFFVSHYHFHYPRHVALKNEGPFRQGWCETLTQFLALHEYK